VEQEIKEKRGARAVFPIHYIFPSLPWGQSRGGCIYSPNAHQFSRYRDELPEEGSELSTQGKSLLLLACGRWRLAPPLSTLEKALLPGHAASIHTV